MARILHPATYSADAVMDFQRVYIKAPASEFWCDELNKGIFAEFKEGIIEAELAAATANSQPTRSKLSHGSLNCQHTH